MAPQDPTLPVVITIKGVDYEFPPGTQLAKAREVLTARGVITSSAGQGIPNEPASKPADQQVAPPTVAATAEKSLGGFLGNVASSTVGQFANLGQALFHPIETVKGVGRLGLGLGEKLIPGEQEHEQYADAAGQFYKDRYGSLDKLAETAYTDPAGLAVDVAGLAGGVGGGMRLAGWAGNLPKVTRIGQALTAVENTVNPMRPVTYLADKTARATGIGTILAGTRPSAKVKRDFRQTPVDVARTIMDNGLVTEGQAVAASEGSKIAARRLRSTAQRGGAQGHAGQIARAVRAEVQPEITNRLEGTGAADQTPWLTDRLNDFRAQHPTGAIPLDRMDELKGTAQTDAFSAGQAGNSLEKMLQEAFAGQYKDQLENLVPGLAPQNARSQRLIAAERAIREAGVGGGTMATVAGVGAAMFDPQYSLPAYAGTRLATLPHATRLAGTIMGGAGGVVDSAFLRRLAMLEALREHTMPSPPAPQP